MNVTSVEQIKYARRPHSQRYHIQPASMIQNNSYSSNVFIVDLSELTLSDLLRSHVSFFAAWHFSLFPKKSLPISQIKTCQYPQKPNDRRAKACTCKNAFKSILASISGVKFKRVCSASQKQIFSAGTTGKIIFDQFMPQLQRVELLKQAHNIVFCLPKTVGSILY